MFTQLKWDIKTWISLKSPFWMGVGVWGVTYRYEVKVSDVIQYICLFLEVKLDPVMETYDFVLADFSDKYVFKAWTVCGVVFGRSAIQPKPYIP